MKQIKKSVLCMVMLACLLLVQTTTVMAGTIYTHEYFNYQLEGKSVIITNYFGDESVVTVPNMIVGYPVSKIATGAFSKNDKVTHVNLPDTIMEVETGAIRNGISVTYASNTDDPKGTLDSTEESVEESVEENTEILNKDSSDTNGEVKIESDNMSVDTEQVSIDGGEVTEEELEKMIQEESESAKQNDTENEIEKSGHDLTIPVILMIVLVGISTVIICKKRLNK